MMLCAVKDYSSLIFIPCILLLLTQNAYAQSNSTGVTGIIHDEDGEAITGASIVIYEDESESTMLTGRSSDARGEFMIPLNPGQYYMKITFISFETYSVMLELTAGEIKDLGSLQLSFSTRELEDIAIDAQRSHMEMNFDSRVFHVEEDITSMGGSALDVLDNVPSLATDFDGNVTLRGSEGVQILINGRPSSLVRNGTDGLDAIPSNMIKKVEVITNPSARYQAEGTGGIINIVLVDGASMGFNGTLSARTGLPHDHRVSGNFNYNVNNINWFIGTNMRYRDRPRGRNIFQESATPDTSYIYQQDSESIQSNRRGRIRFGADVFLPADQVLTATTQVNLQNNRSSADVSYTDYTIQREVIQQINREDISDESDNSFDFRLEYEKRFANDNHRLTADASIGFDREDEYSHLTQVVEEGNAMLYNQRANNFESNTDFRFQADYERPLGESGRFEAGVRSSMEWMYNDYSVDQQEASNWVTIPAYNDNFNYQEMINAGYGIYSGQASSFTWQFGLRAEQTTINTELALLDVASEQSYFDFFPSVFVTWQLSEQSSLQSSYSKRLSRPRSRWLLPFSGYADSRNIYRGNPSLEPEFSNSIESGFLRYWNTGSILTSIYYRHRNGVIEHISSQEHLDGNPVTVRSPINLSSEEAWGIEFTADQEVLNRLQFSGSLNLYQSERYGVHEGVELSSETESFQSRMRIRWQFLDGWNYHSSIRYRGPRSTTQGRQSASSFVNMGVAKELFGRAVVVSFNLRDIFNTRSRDMIIDEPDFYSARTNNWNTRSASLNIRYRFSQN